MQHFDLNNKKYAVNHLKKVGEYMNFTKFIALYHKPYVKSGLTFSRADIGTPGASYMYHYGGFRVSPTEILLDYFDVFFILATVVLYNSCLNIK